MAAEVVALEREQYGLPVAVARARPPQERLRVAVLKFMNFDVHEL